MNTLHQHLLMADTSQTDHLLDYLNSEGFPASIDADGDIVFKSEGLDYALCFDQKDSHFSKVILPNVWQINEQPELNQALLLLDNINRKLKVVKGYTTKDTVWFTVELFHSDVSQLTFSLKRIIRLLAHAALIFAREMGIDKETSIMAP